MKAILSAAAIAVLAATVPAAAHERYHGNSYRTPQQHHQYRVHRGDRDGVYDRIERTERANAEHRFKRRWWNYHRWDHAYSDDDYPRRHHRRHWWSRAYWD